MDEFSVRVFQQFLDLYIMPEIRRRQDDGQLEKPLDLRGAQIIFSPFGDRPQILINSEVQGTAKMKLKNGISKKKGDPIYANEIEDIAGVYLTEGIDPDSGHATLIRVENNWYIYWDFIYNKEFSKNHLLAAKEFIEAAEFSFSENNKVAFIDNLFSASELIVKSVLLGIPDPKFREKATHRVIHSRYNRWANLGNVRTEHRKAFNKIASLRYKVRYLEDEFSLTDSESRCILSTVKSMFADANSRIKRE